MSGGTFEDRERARLALPTREQLMRLAASSEERVLRPDEARQLQIGITHLAAQLGGAGGRIHKLTAELAKARRELDAVRVELGSPVSVACGYCGAAVGSACVSKSDGSALAVAHTARLDEVRRRLGVAS